MTHPKTDSSIASKYYVPHSSYWPILGTIALALIAIGAANALQNAAHGFPTLSLGLLVFAGTLFGWFGSVIKESLSGLYNDQMDRSFRWGMAWFIFSEFMFFAAFFGALFYIRNVSLPWLGGFGDRGESNLLWPQFKATWPLLNNPNPELFGNIKHAMGAWGLPFINTLILLSSGITVTWAHHGLRTKNQKALTLGLFLTFMLGFIFLGLQAYEYIHAYRDLDLKINHGIYGATFYMLTGFHGLHVLMGSIMLVIIWLRSLKHHFTPQKHFAFEAVAWYWHFVDVVWLFLFVFVYWI
ncbi:MAG: cytochrome c oxidase subunit 3 [Gammaproteobacteria bacterium]